MSAFEAVIPDCIDPIIHDIRLNALSLLAEEDMREKMKIAKSTRNYGNPSRQFLTFKEFQKTRGCNHTSSSNLIFLFVFRRSICNFMKSLHSRNKLRRYVSLGMPFVILNCMKYSRTRNASNDIHWRAKKICWRFWVLTNEPL